jgi:hypothetical protein
MSPRKSKAAGLAWLTGQLGGEPGSIAFRTMDARTCERVIRLCKPLWSINRKKAA